MFTRGELNKKRKQLELALAAESDKRGTADVLLLLLLYSFLPSFLPYFPYFLLFSLLTLFSHRLGICSSPAEEERADSVAHLPSRRERSTHCEVEEGSSTRAFHPQGTPFFSPPLHAFFVSLLLFLPLFPTTTPPSPSLFPRSVLSFSSLCFLAVSSFSDISSLSSFLSSLSSPSRPLPTYFSNSPFPLIFLFPSSFSHLIVLQESKDQMAQMQESVRRLTQNLETRSKELEIETNNVSSLKAQFAAAYDNGQIAANTIALETQVNELQKVCLLLSVSLIPPSLS